MVVDPAQVITAQLGRDHTDDNVKVLKFDHDLLTKLNKLADNNHLFDAILIDATLCGYLFPAEVLIEAARLSDNLLAVHGALIFLKRDKAVAIVRDSLTGVQSLHVFDNHAELYDYSPSLTKHIKAALGKSSDFHEESTDLSQQVLMSSIPVLTAVGIKLKGQLAEPNKRNMVLAAIDNYSPIVTIAHKLTERITEKELLEELKQLEQSKAIHAIFPKVPFLVNCFKNKTPFTLKDYLVQAKLISANQLDELLLEINSQPLKQRASLGALAVKRDIMTARQLEIAVQDQAFYGQEGDSQKVKVNAADDAKVQSLVGHLGTTDPSNLLQNLVTNRENGVLSVEYRDMQFRAQFEIGKLTHAKVGKVQGNAAVIEFCSAWRQGIFVFIQRTPPPDLAKDSCKVTKALDKLLLDAALAQDNMEVVWKKLPKGVESVLEKLSDTDDLLNSGTMTDPQEKTKLSDKDVELMRRCWSALDGLTPLNMLIKQMGDVPTADAGIAIGRLLHYGLINIPNIELGGPMGKFQMLVKNIKDHVGGQRVEAFLRLSMRDTLGYSGRARVFVLGREGEVGVDMAAARSANTSLSAVLQDLDNWQVKFIEYVSQDLDRNLLLSIIREVHEAG